MIWMQQNRKELETAFLQDAPAWNVIASYLGDSGIMNGDGKPPTAASARSAWARVRADAQAKAKASGALLGAGASVPAASPTLSVLPADEQEPPRPSHERFTTATLRNHTPAAPPPDPPPPLPAVPRQDSKAVIAALLGRGTRTSSFRKPEPQDE